MHLLDGLLKANLRGAPKPLVHGPLDASLDKRQAELARVSRREQYKKEIEEQKSQRLHMYEVEKTNELAGVEEDKEVEEYRKAVVAEARRRLLEEHSKRLSGFLPKGTIQSQDELALVRGAA